MHQMERGKIYRCDILRLLHQQEEYIISRLFRIYDVSDCKRKNISLGFITSL